jgi:hypothetical protein
LLLLLALMTEVRRGRGRVARRRALAIGVRRWSLRAHHLLVLLLLLLQLMLMVLLLLLLLLLLLMLLLLHGRRISLAGHAWRPPSTRLVVLLTWLLRRPSLLAVGRVRLLLRRA